MMRLQVGDEVVVTSGKHKGSRGKVSKITRDDRVVIEGVNRVKRHVKPSPNQPGGILEVEAPLHASNVMLVDPQTQKPTRVRYEEREGAKVRVAVKSGEVIPSPRAQS